jgi:hypothetical protein
MSRHTPKENAAGAVTVTPWASRQDPTAPADNLAWFVLDLVD